MIPAAEAAREWLSEDCVCDIADRVQRYAQIEPVVRSLAALLEQREAELQSEYDSLAAASRLQHRERDTARAAVVKLSRSSRHPQRSTNELEDEMQAPDGNVGAPVEPAKDAIETLFTYHPPTPEQVNSYKSIREAAMNLARVIDGCCPAGPDRTAAVRHVREAVMTANASIATNNAQYR